MLMTPRMEQLGRWVAYWRASLLGNGLKVNAGKSKVMVVSRWEDDWKVALLRKEYRQTLFSAQYVKMDSQTVQW